jgi:hypothetical protein
MSMKRIRLLTLLAGFVVALVTGCGGDTKTPESTPSRGETPPSTAAASQNATFVVDGLAPPVGQPPMTLAVSIDGNNVAAYACNGVDDEAWFFGTQKDGAVDLKSKYGDVLKAKIEGNTLDGSLTIKDYSYAVKAAKAPEPAGIYTATAGDARATWIVMADQKTTGVFQPNSKRDREVIDQINAQQADFQQQVRQARLDRQLRQAPQLAVATMSADMNGSTVRAVRVTANMTSPPSSG